MSVTLDSDSLFSRYGFRDGDILDDFDCCHDGPAYGPNDLHFDHAVLLRLVERHLLPALPRRIRLDIVHTHHNPIRIADDQIEASRDLMGYEVTVSASEIESMASEVREEREAAQHAFNARSR